MLTVVTSLFIPGYLPQCHGVCAWWGVDVSITGHSLPWCTGHSRLWSLLSDGPLIDHGIVLAPLWEYSHPSSFDLRHFWVTHTYLVVTRILSMIIDQWKYRIYQRTFYDQCSQLQLREKSLVQKDKTIVPPHHISETSMTVWHHS